MRTSVEEALRITGNVIEKQKNISKRTTVEEALKITEQSIQTKSGAIFNAIQDDYSKNINFDTLSSDIASLGKTVKSIYNGWQSKKTMDSTKPQIESMYSRLKALQSYNSQFGDGSVDVSEQINAYKSVLDEWDKIAESYGKYKNADEYNKSTKNQVNYDTYNFEENKENIRLLESDLAAIKNVKNQITNLETEINTLKLAASKGSKDAINKIKEKEERITLLNSSLEKAWSNYGDEEGLKSAIAQKKATLKSAKRYQSLQKLFDVVNPESKNYDKNFEKYVQIGNSTDYKTVGQDNTTTIRSEHFSKTDYRITNTRAAAIALAEHNGADKNTTGGDLYDNVAKYRLFKPEEFDLLAYYMGKDKETGGKQTEEYLALMEETLNQREGNEIYEKHLKDNTFLEVLYGVPVGLDQFSSGIKNLLNTKDDYIPASAVQIAGQNVREDLADDGFKLPDWLGGASIAQIGYDTLSTTANMAPSILVSLIPGVGQTAGAVLMGASAAGNAYQEALNNGMDKGQARVYSTLVGASEAVLSRTVSKVFGGKVLSNKITTAIEGIEKSYIRFATNYAWAFASEGLEEAAQEILTPLFENIALGYKKNGFEDIDWSEVAYSFLLGGLSGGNFEVVGSAMKRITNIATVRKNYNTPQKVQNLLKLGLSLPKESKANILAEKYNTEVANQGKLSVNKLYNIAVASENFISDKLTQFGEKNNVSEVASAVVKKLTGIELSTTEKEVLSKSSFGQEALKAVVSENENPIVTENDTNNPSQTSPVQSFSDDLDTTQKNRRLTQDDLKTYMQVGKTQHTRNKKTRMLESGKKPILTSALEIKDFILNIIRGKALGEVRAYGKVGKRLSEAIKKKRGNLDLEGKYLELNADDLREAYKRHSTPKEKGDIALSDEDFINIPEYIDEFDYVLGVNEYNGKIEIHLAKETADGYVKILTISSKERESLQISKIIGISKEKFDEKYGKKIERDTGSLRGLSDPSENSNPSTTAQLTAGTLPTDIIGEKPSNVNTIISESEQNNTQADPNGPANFMPERGNGGEIKRHHTTEAEQDFIKRICDKLGVKMKFIHITPELLAEKGYEFEDGLLPDGFYDKDTDTLYIGFTVIDPVNFVFKHELTHFGEGTEQYTKFVEAVKKSKAYKEWLIKRSKLNPDVNSIPAMEAAVRRKYMEARKQERDFGPAKAESEMIADFVGEYLFNEDGSTIESILSGLNQKERNAVIQYILDFLSYLKKKLQGESDLVFEISRLEDNFNRMLSEAVQTKKEPSTENGGDLSFSINSVVITQSDIKKNISDIVKLESVAELSGKEFSKGEKDLISQVDEYFAKFEYSVENPILGDVDVTARGAKDSIAHGIGRNKAIAFAAVPNVIKNGKIIDYQTNWKNRGYDTVVLAAPVTINNHPYYEGVIVIRDSKTQRFYVHEVITEERTDMSFKTGADNKVGKSGDTSSPSIISLLDKIRVVKEKMATQEVDNNKYAQSGSNNSKGNIQFSFARPDDMSLVEEAEKEEAKWKAENKSERVIRRKVWDKTGLIRDSSGEWVYEIDDSEMVVSIFGDHFIDNTDKLNRIALFQKIQKLVSSSGIKSAKSVDELFDNLHKIYGYKSLVKGKLQDFVKHDALFEKYPELRDYDFQICLMPKETSGGWNATQKTIKLNAMYVYFYITEYTQNGFEECEKFIKNTIAHEIQHAVQHFDGRDDGANQGMWESFKKRWGKLPINPLTGMEYTFEKAYEYDQGEYEARQTKSRREYDKVKRKKKVPNLGWGKLVNVNFYKVDMRKGDLKADIYKSCYSKSTIECNRQVLSEKEKYDAVEIIKNSKTFKKWYTEETKEKFGADNPKIVQEMIVDFLIQYIYNEDFSYFEGLFDEFNYKNKDFIMQYVLDYINDENFSDIYQYEQEKEPVLQVGFYSDNIDYSKHSDYDLEEKKDLSENFLQGIGRKNKSEVLKDEGKNDILKLNKDSKNIVEDLENGFSGLKPKNLMQELENSGVKYNPDSVILIIRTIDGKLLWLEQGNSKAGLIHILQRHTEDFLSQDIYNIQMLLNDVLKTVPIKKGGNSKGLFADYLYNGKIYRVAYGTNGYIVSFYPVD